MLLRDISQSNIPENRFFVVHNLKKNSMREKGAWVAHLYKHYLCIIKLYAEMCVADNLFVC